MMRLVRRGLMYGNLFEVRAPALVARYNRALKHLTGKTTKLEEFHIDISGFSPEIGVELDDKLYLNPDGFNRKFILLSVEQKRCPLLNARLSMSRDILEDYISRHEEQLFILSARDAVVGELVNSAYSINNIDDLFTIRNIEVEADTVGSDVEAGDELTRKIRKFISEQDAWWDDVLIADMIELSRRTGNILHDPIRLETYALEQTSFHTSHFGGVYLFRDIDEPALITTGEVEAQPNWPVKLACSLSDRVKVAAFLNLNTLVEPILDATDMNGVALLQQKMDFIVIDTAANNGDDLSELTRRDFRNLKRKFHQDLPAEYHAMENILKSVAGGFGPMRIKPEDPAYFYLLRSRNHRDKRLVNMLLAQLTPLDFRQLFFYHKDAFYSSYHSWNDAKQNFVAQFLEEEHAAEKAGARAELFGPEPGMFGESNRIDPPVWHGPWGPAPSEH